MAYSKKTWHDRVAEYATRRMLTKENGTTELVTVARAEGTISQEGDAFSAENMNDLEDRIGAEFGGINGQLGEIYLGDNNKTTVELLNEILTSANFTLSKFRHFRGKSADGYIVGWGQCITSAYVDGMFTLRKSSTLIESYSFERNLTSAGADTVLKKLGEPEYITQTLSTGTIYPEGSTLKQTKTLTFSNLKNIVGFTAWTYGGKVSNITTSISGNKVTVTATFSADLSGTVSLTAKGEPA